MERLRCLLLIVAALVAPASVGRAQETWHASLDDARREAQRLNRPILLHFGAEWCGPCRLMEATVLNQPRVASQLHTNIVGVKVDVDRHKELANRFLIDAFPTDVLLEPDGKELLVSKGGKSLDEYLILLDRGTRRYRELLVQREERRGPPIVAEPATGEDTTQLAKSAEPMLMLEGYCPYTLASQRQWILGKPAITTVIKGQRYHFVTAEAMQKFLENPDRFSPQFLGCDPVIAWTTDRSVLGSIEWGAFYDDRLYLFSTEENRKAFKAAPEKYLQTKVVLHVDDIESVWR